MFRKLSYKKANAAPPPTVNTLQLEFSDITKIIEQDDINKLEDFINRKKIKLDERIGLNTPILCLAALYASEKIFNYLIERLTPEQIAQSGDDGQNALISACTACEPYQKAHKARVRIAAKLIEKKIDINRADNTKQTAMHIAAKYHFNDMIKLLAEHQAEIDPRDQFGRTPLSTHIVTNKGNTSNSTIRLLCEKGANIYEQDNSGVSPLNHTTNYTLKQIMLDADQKKSGAAQTSNACRRI